MKKIITGIFGYVACLILIVGTGLLFHHARASEQQEQLQVAISQAKTVVHEEGSFSVAYTNFNGHPVLLEYNPQTRQVTVRAKSDVGFEFGAADHSIEFLKSEVIRLTSATNGIMLANGYSFRFKGGYPIWSPSIVNYKTGIFRGLTFAMAEPVTDAKVFLANGLEYQPYGYENYSASR